MFIHNLKYTIKTLFKNKILVFWTFAFPIILGIFFNMAFSNIEKDEVLKVFDIAVVDNDEFETQEIYKNALKELSDNDNKDNKEKQSELKEYTSLYANKVYQRDGKMIGLKCCDSLLK